MISIESIQFQGQIARNALQVKSGKMNVILAINVSREYFKVRTILANLIWREGHSLEVHKPQQWVNDGTRIYS